MIPSALSNGTILRERYIITAIAGQGGMGSVYRAEDARLPGRLCAIKEVVHDSTASPMMRNQAQAQFLQEASILAKLDHPNLPKVSDFFSEEEPGRDYLVMDYVPGQNLKEILDGYLTAEQLLEESLVLGWANQILDALEYLHKQTPPVLHRDIKPSNIKLTPDNRIKLVDFGLAKLLATDDMRTITIIQGRGTALYTPLEQYGDEYDHTDVRSDIYALGATLYTLLTGTPPPSAKDRFLRPAALRPVTFHNPSVTTAVAQAVSWSIEMHPDQRPQDATIMRQALHGRATPPATLFHYATDNQRGLPNPRPWATFTHALHHNRWLILTTILLTLLAIWQTFTSY